MAMPVVAIARFCSTHNPGAALVSMKQKFRRRGWVIGAGSILALNIVSFCSLAQADTLLFTGPGQTCTGVNCGSTFLNGFSHKDSFGESVPFTLQVHGAPPSGNFAGDCIRIDVVRQDVDMEVVVISPSGTVWRNDDRAPGDLRPLLTVRADVDGFYTVQINQFNGNQPINSLQTFTVAYGRYSLNPVNQDNCPSPSSPVVTASVKK